MPLKLDSWAGFVLEQLLLVCFLLVFVVSCFRITKSLRLANSFLFVFVFVSSRCLINISFQGLTPSAQIPRERFPIPKFMFRASLISLTKDIVKQVNSVVYNFIWNSGKDKIKRLTLIRNYKNGGLRMPHTVISTNVVGSKDEAKRQDRKFTWDFYE